jgi:hypothetical protein
LSPKTFHSSSSDEGPLIGVAGIGQSNAVIFSQLRQGVAR